MAGVPKSHLRRYIVNPDIHPIIDRFLEAAGRNATKSVCAVCTKRDVILGEKYKLLRITHNYLELLKIDEEDLPTNRKSLAYHILFTFDDEHYRIDPAGFDTKTNMVTACAY